jgi:hypothetical protein
MALQNEVPLSFWDFFQFRGTGKFYPQANRVGRILDVAQTKVKYDRLWRFFGPQPDTALNNLTQLYYKKGEYTRAKPLYEQARKGDRVSFNILFAFHLRSQ